MTLRATGAPTLPKVRRRVTRRLRDILADTPIDGNLDVAALCRTLGATRGRPITLVAMGPLLRGAPAPFTGLWIRSTSADYLFYDDTTSPMHGRHSQLHELGHLLLDHKTSGDVRENYLLLLRKLLPDLDPEALRRAVPAGLCRLGGATEQSGYSAGQEVEAEAAADTLWQWLGDPGVAADRPAVVDGSDADAVCRLAFHLGDTCGHDTAQ